MRYTAGARCPSIIYAQARLARQIAFPTCYLEQGKGGYNIQAMIREPSRVQIISLGYVLRESLDVEMLIIQILNDSQLKSETISQ